MLWVSGVTVLGTLLHAGIEIHVFLPTMLHTKLLAIDVKFVSVGSTNFDIRSIRINDQASLNVYSSDFATQDDGGVRGRSAGGRVVFPCPLEEPSVESY